jgi:hypothetical protein
VVWGLELMLLFVERGAIEQVRAVSVAQRIHEDNPTHITATVLSRFVKKLQAATKGG